MTLTHDRERAPAIGSRVVEHYAPTAVAVIQHLAEDSLRAKAKVEEAEQPWLPIICIGQSPGLETRG